MFKFKELIERDMDKLAAILTSEHGKVLSDAKGEVIRGLEVVEFACGIPQLLKGEFTEQIGTGIDSYSVRQPLGVCAGITPFNFPVMVPMWMFPISIACGNTFVLKPSERDPSASVCTLPTCSKKQACPTAYSMSFMATKLPSIPCSMIRASSAISFVGSTPIAEYVYRTGTAAGKRVQALGGAKNHLVVMPDADLDQAVDALTGAGLWFSRRTLHGDLGRRCRWRHCRQAGGKTRRAREIAEDQRRRPKAILTWGRWSRKQHLDKVTGYVDTGVEEGATLVVDGRGHKVKGHENGASFIGGCLFDNVKPDMTIYKEEIFGPVLSIVRVPDFESAVNLINAHEFGNGVSLFTRDGDAAREFSMRIQIGMVGINVPIPVPMAFHSFRRMEAIAVRRPLCVRPGGRALSIPASKP